MNYNLIIPVLIFISLVLFAAGVFIFVESKAKRRLFIDKIRNTADEASSQDMMGPQDKTAGRFEKSLYDLMGRLGKLLKHSKEDVSRMRLRLLRAGYYGMHSAAYYLGSKVFMAVLLPAAVFSLVLVSIKVLTPVYVIATIALSALAGFYIPDLWLKLRTSIRKDSILHGFPDALDLLVVCVEAGMGLDSAMTRVGEEMKLGNKDLYNELRMLNLEQRAGKERKDALRNLAARTDLEEVNSLTTLLIQTDRFGTSIAQALRVHSDFLRTRRYQKAEELAAKLPVKLVFPLIIFIFPALFITIMGPAVINIIRAFAPVVQR